MMSYSDWKDLFWVFVFLGIVFFVCSLLLDGRDQQACSGILSVLFFVAAAGMKPLLNRLKKHDN